MFIKQVGKLMTDPIADMLTRIRNAQAVRKVHVIVPYSKMKDRLGHILLEEGFVQQVEILTTGSMRELKITLKYYENQAVIRDMKRVSKPGHRVYVGSRNLPFVLNDLGVAIVSTSQGLMTNKEARKKKLGGELLCEIY